MRLRRAVLKSPPKPPVPPRLLLHKNRHPLTRPESTLPQLLIPLHFNSSKCNAYKKPGGVCPLQALKVLQLVTPSTSPIWSHRNANNPNPSIHLRTLSIAPGGVGQPILAVYLGLSHGSRATHHRPRLLWPSSTVAPRPAKCQNHECCCFAAPRETSPLLPVSNTGERTSDRASAGCQISIASRSRMYGRDRTSKKAWVQRSKSSFMAWT
jgi:hypothetical protein